jgi:coenzyme PQQ synthesis protein D (PqqD)
MMLRRIETQAALAETTERGKFGVRAVAQLSAHMGVLFDTMEMNFSWAINWPSGWAAMVMFSDKVSVPAHVLVRFLDKEAVLLNIETERYFGLDETGARMWQLATTAANIDAAYQALLSEYDVDGETLREHLSELLEKLAGNGLLTMTPSDVGTTAAI